jgi:hypothetical protein
MSTSNIDASAAAFLKLTTAALGALALAQENRVNFLSFFGCKDVINDEFDRFILSVNGALDTHDMGAMMELKAQAEDGNQQIRIVATRQGFRPYSAY